MREQDAPGGDDGWPFSLVQRVRFGDLDAMQHMNNVEFLRFFETARIDYLRTVLPDHVPTSGESFGFIFAECHVNYRSPAHYDEEIRTWIRPAELRRSSARLEFRMTSDNDGGRLVAEGWGTLVGYDYGAGRATPIPETVRATLEQDIAAAAD